MNTLYWFKKLYLSNKIFKAFILLILYLLLVAPIYYYGKADGKRINTEQKYLIDSSKASKK